MGCSDREGWWSQPKQLPGLVFDLMPSGQTPKASRANTFNPLLKNPEVNCLPFLRRRASKAGVHRGPAVGPQIVGGT